MNLFNKCNETIKFLRYKAPELKRQQVEFQQIVQALEGLDGLDDHDYFDAETAVPQTSLKSFNKTRWNSRFALLDSVDVNQPVINPILRKYEKFDELHLNPIETIVLKELIKFLKEFKEATVYMQGNNYPTLSLVWPTVKALIAKCNSSTE